MLIVLTYSLKHDQLGQPLPLRPTRHPALRSSSQASGCSGFRRRGTFKGFGLAESTSPKAANKPPEGEALNGSPIRNCSDRKSGVKLCE